MTFQNFNLLIHQNKIKIINLDWYFFFYNFKHTQESRQTSQLCMLDINGQKDLIRQSKVFDYLNPASFFSIHHSSVSSHRERANLFPLIIFFQ